MIYSTGIVMINKWIINEFSSKYFILFLDFKKIRLSKEQWALFSDHPPPLLASLTLTYTEYIYSYIGFLEVHPLNYILGSVKTIAYVYL